MTASVPALALRPATEADLPFLFRLYASTRAEELAPLPWSEEQKQAFLRMQFEAQTRHYALHFGGDRCDLILADGEPAGRWYIGRWTREIRVIDVSLLPAWRGRGIGGALLSELQREAAGSGRLVGIHVEMSNPARRLYQRLGFVVAEPGEVYDFMTWNGATARSAE
jgi:ribosomal protein S18 acetylase RimI-like enzyme